MKTWLILFCIVGLIAIAIVMPIQVPYSYTGDRAAEVQAGLDTWREAGITFVPVASTRSLIIMHASPAEFVLSQTAKGENVGNKIRISNRYPLTTSHFIGLVSHEAGHFLGLPHNSEPSSVMNLDLPLTTRPTARDIRGVKWLKPFIFLDIALAFLHKT